MGNTLRNTAWFLIIRSSTEDLLEVQLKAGQNNIGRSADNDIILQDHAASNQHAKIIFDQSTNKVSIRDLDSTNGTFVNGKRVQDLLELQQDDQIRMPPSVSGVVI